MMAKNTDVNPITDIIFHDKKSIATMEPNEILDRIIWCNFVGYKTRVGGKKIVSIFKRCQYPNVSLERFIGVNFDIFWNENANREKLDLAFTRLVNQTNDLDCDMIHKMINGKLVFDIPSLIEYVGSRTITLPGTEIKDELLIPEEMRVIKKKKPRKSNKKKETVPDVPSKEEKKEEKPKSLVENLTIGDLKKMDEKLEKMTEENPDTIGDLFNNPSTVDVSKVD